MNYLDENQKEVKNAAYYRRQVKKLEEKMLRNRPTEAEILLKDLAEALDGAFISTWQTTSAWQKELDAALDYVREQNYD